MVNYGLPRSESSHSQASSESTNTAPDQESQEFVDSLEDFPLPPDTMVGQDTIMGESSNQEMFDRFIETLRGLQFPQPPPAQTASSKRKEIDWPRWDGSPESFPFFRTLLESKIEVDRDLLAKDGRGICLSMVGTLPDDKKLRVSHWFQTGGEAGQWDWKEFLKHFTAQFEDPLAQQAAADQLHRCVKDVHNTLQTSYRTSSSSWHRQGEVYGQEWSRLTILMQASTLP